MTFPAHNESSIKLEVDLSEVQRPTRQKRLTDEDNHLIGLTTGLGRAQDSTGETTPGIRPLRRESTGPASAADELACKPGGFARI